jgi:hypothetical protein
MDPLHGLDKRTGAAKLDAVIETRVREREWFLPCDSTNHNFCDHRGQMLFIDARKPARPTYRTYPQPEGAWV